MDSSKVTKIAIVAVVAALVGAGWFFGRYLLLTMHVSEVLTAFPRHPNPQDVFALKGKVIEEAKKVKIAPEDIDVEVSLEQFDIGGGPGTAGGMAVGDSKPDRWWFVVVRVWKPGRTGKPL